jgi:hypothetical protein
VCGLCPCGCTIKSNQRGVVETVCNGISKPTDQVLSMLDQQPCETQKDSTRDIRMTFFVVAEQQNGAPKCRRICQWHTGSLLAFDVDSPEGSLLATLKDHAGFTSREADATIIFPLDQVFTTVVADELYAIARSSIGIFVFALEGKPFDDRVKADIWLVPVQRWLACVYT